MTVSTPGGRPENLNPVRTEGEAREKGRKGGIASGRKRAERKAIAETLDILLRLPMQNGKSKSLERVKALDKESIGKANAPTGELLALAMLQKALKGDTKAMRMIMELLGEGQQTQTVSPLDGLAEELRRYREQEEEE